MYVVHSLEMTSLTASMYVRRRWSQEGAQVTVHLQPC
jgi:hypothetical protein